MNCFEGCINPEDFSRHPVKKTRSKSGPSLRKKKSIDWNFDYNSHPFVVEDVIKARTLKPLPITKNNKTGDFFHHPDIPIIDMDELVREALGSQGFQDETGNQSSSISTSDLKFAWMSKNVFQKRRASVNFTPLLEIQCMDIGEKEVTSSKSHSSSSATHQHQQIHSSSTNCYKINEEEIPIKYNSSFNRTRDSQTRKPIKEDSKIRKSFWSKLPKN